MTNTKAMNAVEMNEMELDMVSGGSLRKFTRPGKGVGSKFYEESTKFEGLCRSLIKTSFAYIVSLF